MDEAEFHERLVEILGEEERADPDWERVEALCLELARRLARDSTVQCPDSVYHFVDDPDIRRRDERYAEEQRDLVRWYLQTGEMTEHAPSKRVTWWGCLLIVAAIVGLVAWVLA
jgi:hypothetical protein